jgi:hypothetical protein
MRTSLNRTIRLIRSYCGLLILFFPVAGAPALLHRSEQRERPADRMPEAPLPTRAQISNAIALSGGYLERSCGPDGKFVYEIDINTGKQTSSSYNIVRHSGAIYALAMLNRSTPDRKAVDAMVRAATFMRQNYIGSGPRPDQLVVWSEPTTHRSEAELGATGLGLVALAEVRRVTPKSVPLEDLQALGRFALFLQKEDGSFVLLYRPETGPVEHFYSPYYAGETALGFIALYEADHSREWLTAAGKALSYLVKNHAESSDRELDQWALIASAKLLPYCDREACPGVSRMDLVKYATQACDWIVREQLRNPTSPLDGAFDPPGHTAVVAARLEGLLAALEFLPNGQTRTKVEAAAGRSVAFLLRAQIGSGQFTGGLPGALRTSAPSSAEIRIDYVQHALCAWLRYQKLLLGKASFPVFAAPSLHYLKVNGLGINRLQ